MTTSAPIDTGERELWAKRRGSQRVVSYDRHRGLK